MKRLMVLLLALLLTGGALAEEAKDITGACTFLRKTSQVDFTPMMDDKYATFYKMNPRRVIEIHGEEDISAVYVQFFYFPAPLEVYAGTGGAWTLVGKLDGRYLTEYVPLPEGTRQVRLVNSTPDRVDVAEITLFGAGEKPAYVPQWEEPAKADLMLVATHPDDELLWFGGLLPTYAGEKDLAVQVTYLVPSIGYRRLELLDGLWHCGVETYPLFLEIPDKRAPNLSAQYKLWNKNYVLGKVVEAIRRVQPEVIVTQDERGEYGHGGHRVCADICKLAITAAADASVHPASAKQYGVWQAKKLYLHLYKENQLRMDWRVPLAAFQGQDGLTVATQALACHVSQTNNGWAMEEGGPYDNELFGLYFTTVGEDVNKDDFMENIPAEYLVLRDN